jgi:hypothetical protein
MMSAADIVAEARHRLEEAAQLRAQPSGPQPEGRHGRLPGLAHSDD